MRARTAIARGRRGAFTLVELGVVVAIIAVLAALLVPALSRGIDRGRHTKCVSNLRQIYGALQGYGTDHDGHLPVMLTARASSGDQGPTLDTVLGPVLGDLSVFHCPADRHLFAQSGCSYLWVYGLSVNASGQQNDNLMAPTFPLLQENRLSRIAFVSDKEGFHHTAPSVQILYGDGHVE